MTRRFGGVTAIDGVTFDIRPGEILGLLGPNGAGKTTTMRVLTGYLRPTTGSVRVGGDDPAVARLRVGRLLGYVPEASALYAEMSVRSYLAHWARLRGVPRRDRSNAVAKAVRSVGLGEVLHQRVGSLSRGFRQRVSIAQALVHDPPVLILDEPTAGLDPRQVADTRNLIARLGRRKTVLLSSHLLNEVTQLCRRVVVLDRGRVVAVGDVASLTGASTGVRLELRVAGPLERAAGVARRVPGVTSAAVRGDVIVIAGQGEGLPAAVSAAVVGDGISLVELRHTGTGTLEDAYLRLVSE